MAPGFFHPVGSESGRVKFCIFRVRTWSSFLPLPLPLRKSRRRFSLVLSKPGARKRNLKLHKFPLNCYIQWMTVGYHDACRGITRTCVFPRECARSQGSSGAMCFPSKFWVVELTVCFKRVSKPPIGSGNRGSNGAHLHFFKIIIILLSIPPKLLRGINLYRNIGRSLGGK